MNEVGGEVGAGHVGFTCAYTPLPLISAAGFVPYRVLPVTDAPDEAGTILHDNICHHVKGVLDRAVAAELPPLSGMVFVSSCDAMRRLADAWRVVRPADRRFVLDLPPTVDDTALGYLESQLVELAESLVQWGGRRAEAKPISSAVARLNELARVLEALEERAREGALGGGYGALQELRARSVTEPIDQSLQGARSMLDEPPLDSPLRGVPLYLAGNVFPDPAAYQLLESCGVRLVGDDVCTGGRQLWAGPELSGDDLFLDLSRMMLSRPACSRTFRTDLPGAWADDVVAAATSRGARGVVVHTVKFCDPYLVRLPGLRTALNATGLPLLVLEGDCTLRSLGQHRTRIEAFVEMLGGVS